MSIRQAGPQSIPDFALYGEAVLAQQPEFIHIEDIASRSRRHGWLIRPHRHGHLFQVLFLYDGSMKVCFDEQQQDLDGSWAVCIPPGFVHGFRFPADTCGMVLSVVDAFLMPDPSLQVRSGFDSLLEVPCTIGFAEKDVLLVQIRQYLEQIRAELEQREHGHAAMLHALMHLVLLTLKRQQLLQADQRHGHESGRRQLFREFRHLLDRRYREHWRVQAYAQALGVSVSTLTRTCQQQAGQAAKNLVQERLLLEIKRRLIYTTEPLESMAYTLGFKDPAYFSRFFRKLAQMTLSEYRRVQYGRMDTQLP